MLHEHRQPQRAHTLDENQLGIKSEPGALGRSNRLPSPQAKPVPTLAEFAR